jgi:hypothetical protein
MVAALGFQSSSGAGCVALGGASNVSLNGAGIGIAFLCQASTVNAITRIRFRFGSRTGTPPSYVVTLETVGADGRPSGTDIGGGSPTATVFTPPASTAWDGTIQEITLENSWTPTARSDWFWVTIRHSSGTVDAGNFGSFTSTFNSIRAAATHTRGFATLSGGTWTLSGQVGNVAFGTATELFGILFLTFYSTATANTAGHRSGVYFTLPSGFGSTYQVRGISFTGKGAAASGSYKVCIWDTSGTEITSVTVDADISQGATSNRQIEVLFDTLATLSFGTKYYAGIEVISGTVYVSGLLCGDADGKSIFPLGSLTGLATYNGTSWTETATTHILFELLFEDITVPSGGGAGAIIIGGLGQTGIGSF